MAGISRPIWPGRPDPAPADPASDSGWTERYNAGGFSGADTDFAAGGSGTAATFAGATWTAHINQVSGSGVNSFASSASGLAIGPDYRTNFYQSPAAPKCPMIWAGVDDLIAGWTGETTICLQARLSYDVAWSSNFENGGLALWEPGAAWASRLGNTYNSGNKILLGRENGSQVREGITGTLANRARVLEWVIYPGALFFEPRYYLTWSGDWPAPRSGVLPTDWRFVAQGDLEPGDSANRPVSAAGLRVGVFATDDSSGGSDFVQTLEDFRVLELVE